MAGWGVSLIGLQGVMRALGDIQTQLTDTGVFIVGTRASYGAYVELGTASTSAQPYLGPAARAAERNPAAYIAQHTNTTVGELGSPRAIIKALALAIERDASQRAPVDLGNLTASITSSELSDWPAAAEQAIDEAPNPERLRA